MIVVPMRLKVLAATGVLAGALGVTALSGVFAAPEPVTNTATSDVAAPTATATVTATAVPRRVAPGFVQGRGRFRGLLGPVAGFLGISTTELQTDLKNGQTPAQIAQAHGKSTADLVAFLKGQLKSRLDQAVANQRITSQQETKILNNSDTRLQRLVNTNFQQLALARRGRLPGIGFGGVLLPTVAQTLGLSVQDVRRELQSGKTLAQIAQEHGKTSADLENAIIASLKPRLDQLMNTNFQQLRQQRGWPGRGRPAAGGLTPASAARGTGA